MVADFNWAGGEKSWVKGGKKPRFTRKRGSIICSVNKNHEPPLDNLVFIQNWLRPALTPVLKNRDHQRLVEDLEKLDQSLRASGLETKAIEFALEGLQEGVSTKQRNRRAEFALYALRVEVLRQMLGVPFFSNPSQQ